MKHFVTKQLTFSVPFMGETVEVRKLSMNDVKAIQDFENKKSKSKKDDDNHHKELMLLILKIAVVGAEDLTLEDLQQLSLPDLNELIREIMKSIGITTGGAADTLAGN